MERLRGVEWNPRYRRYAAAHGRTPADQLKHDDNGKGGKMLPFIVWMHGAWDAFDDAHGISVRASIDVRRLQRFAVLRARGMSPPDPQAAFDAWLATWEGWVPK